MPAIQRVRVEVWTQDLWLTGRVSDGGKLQVQPAEHPMEQFVNFPDEWTSCVLGAPFGWVDRRQIARAMFAGQRERLALYRRTTYVADTIRLADAAEQRATR